MTASCNRGKLKYKDRRVQHGLTSGFRGLPHIPLPEHSAFSLLPVVVEFTPNRGEVETAGMFPSSVKNVIWGTPGKGGGGSGAGLGSDFLSFGDNRDIASVSNGRRGEGHQCNKYHSCCCCSV